MSLLNYYLEIAYKFYPKGVSELKKEIYSSTKENKLLESTKLANIQRNNLQWNELLKEVKKRFPDARVYSFDYYLNSYERSFPVCLSFDRKGSKFNFINLVLHISVLIDSFIVYQTYPEKFSTSNDMSFATYNIEKSVLQDYYKLIEVVESFFPDHKQFPIEVIEENIPDIMYEGIGIVNDKEGNLHAGFQRQMNLYNAFFSSQYYYNA
ncbi:hypothetical protein HHL16_08700 [Pseudoflavitalea sp. G-6-1-2]|uniref:hypothetical protein n=1 Tax=Pseudoflavitalea sp. G-6-1-2 TaxID=2728841 RepID=UPI00146F5694|nr:hypothetical protein [Pseudoflavitalea sp. G-6-1-2]NML20951.1 hypothetical protein [Pseudoflavitalea sp. G-6-1-2]